MFIYIYITICVHFSDAYSIHESYVLTGSCFEIDDPMKIYLHHRVTQPCFIHLSPAFGSGLCSFCIVKTKPVSPSQRSSVYVYTWMSI